MAKIDPKSPRQRLLSLTADKQAQLLEPAQTEFIEHGYSNASLNRVLKNAGMSKGQAYYYISGKADLYQAVCERAFSGIRELANEHSFQSSSPAAFWASVEELFEKVIILLNQDKVLAALGRSLYESAEAESALSDSFESLQNFFINIVRDGQTAGAIRTDLPEDLIAMTVFGALREADKWFVKNLNTLNPKETMRLSSTVFEMLHNLTAPRS